MSVDRVISNAHQGWCAQILWAVETAGRGPCTCIYPIYIYIYVYIYRCLFYIQLDMQISLYRPLSLDTSNHDISHTAWQDILGRIQRPWKMFKVCQTTVSFWQIVHFDPFSFPEDSPIWLIFFKWYCAPLLTLPQKLANISHQTHGEVGVG